MVFESEFFDRETDERPSNPLLQYLQHQAPEDLDRIARSTSPEIKEIISHNVRGMVGVLPTEGFDIQISTDRDNLVGLLTSAMMTGYFLRQMEQRMELEKRLKSH